MTQQTTPNLSQGIPLKSLNLIGMIGQSIRYYRWTMLLVAIGAAATTAVMVGALLVGESVRGSMQSLVMDRLGRIDQLLLTPRFIDADSAARMGSSKSYPPDFEKPVPAILFPRGSAEATSGSQTVRAGSILIVGCDPTFWELNDIHPAKLPAGREVVLNDALATELGAHIGDEVTL